MKILNALVVHLAAVDVGETGITFVINYQGLSLTVESHWVSAFQRIRSKGALYFDNIEQISHP